MTANGKSQSLKESVLCEIEVVYTPKRQDVPQKKISSSRDAYDVFMEVFDSKTICFREYAYALYLDRVNNVLGYFHLSTGSTAGTIIDVKQVLSIALKCNASGVILAHNHPSGNLVPSEADIKITAKIKKACKILDISLHDHLIISQNGYYSMAEEGVF